MASSAALVKVSGVILDFALIFSMLQLNVLTVKKTFSQFLVFATEVQFFSNKPFESFCLYRHDGGVAQSFFFCYVMPQRSPFILSNQWLPCSNEFSMSLCHSSRNKILPCSKFTFYSFNHSTLKGIGAWCPILSLNQSRCMLKHPQFPTCTMDSTF